VSSVWRILHSDQPEARHRRAGAFGRVSADCGAADGGGESGGGDLGTVAGTDWDLDSVRDLCHCFLDSLVAAHPIARMAGEVLFAFCTISATSGCCEPHLVTKAFMRDFTSG